MVGATTVMVVEAPRVVGAITVTVVVEGHDVASQGISEVLSLLCVTIIIQDSTPACTTEL